MFSRAFVGRSPGRDGRDTARGRTRRRDGVPAVARWRGNHQGLLGISTYITERHRAEKEQGTCRPSCSSRRSSRASGCSRAASRTTSTTSSRHPRQRGLALCACRPITRPRTASRRDRRPARRRPDAADARLRGKGPLRDPARSTVETGRRVGGLLATMISKKVQLRSSSGARACRDRGRRAQVHQVVMNLVTNGAEALGDSAAPSRRDRHARTSTKTPCEGSPVGERICPPDATCSSRSRDTGCGMDAATHRADLRSVLHDEVHRPRARPRGGARHRARPQGRGAGPLGSRTGDDVQGPVPATAA